MGQAHWKLKSEIPIMGHVTVLTHLVGFFFALLGLFITEAEGAEFRIQPAVTVGEEYNDNIFLTPTDRVEDYITRFTPSFILHYGTSLWNWDIDYAYDYRYYAHRTRTDDTTQRADLRNHTELIKEFFFIDMSDTYSRVSLDVARDYTNESSFVNQSDRNIFNLNPYVVIRSGTRPVAKLGYMYVNTWYKDPSAVDTIDNVGYADVITQISSRATFTTGAKYTRDENDFESYDQTDIYAGPKYTYAENSYIFLTLGNTWLNGRESNNTMSQFFWNAAISHQYSTVTVSFETSLSFIQNPVPAPGQGQHILRRQDRYVATVRKETTRTALVVSGGLWEYRDPITKHLEDSNYQLTGMMSHALTPLSRIILNLIIQRFEHNQRNTYSDRYISGVRLEHQAANNLTLALGYQYTNSYSPDVYSDNYQNNRVTMELIKRF